MPAAPLCRGVSRDLPILDLDRIGSDSRSMRTSRQRPRREAAQANRPLDAARHPRPVIDSAGINPFAAHNYCVDDLGDDDPLHRHPSAGLRADARRRCPLHRIATIFGIGSGHKRASQGIYNRAVARPRPSAGQDRAASVVPMRAS
jgi:hypothetical protein